MDAFQVVVECWVTEGEYCTKIMLDPIGRYYLMNVFQCLAKWGKATEQLRQLRDSFVVLDREQAVE